MRLAIKITLLLILMCCGKDVELIPPSRQPSFSLGELENANNIGIITGFNADNSVATSDSIQQRWNDLLDEGMGVGRLQIDWPDLEPTPGLYITGDLEDKLTDYREQGLKTMLLIAAYDSEGPVVPSDLVGLPFSDARLIQRFNQLLDLVIPILSSHGGYVISVANEPDNGFSAETNLAGDIHSFLIRVKEHIHSINPRMAVTVTLAEANLDREVRGLEDIIEACDVACWNFYGSNMQNHPPYSIALESTDLRAEIVQMVRKSNGKEIIIQELGMHTGGDRLNSSERQQAAFFRVFFEEMLKYDELRVAYVFQMVDWSPALTESYLKLFEGEGVSQAFVDAFAESLNTIGVINYHDGTAKAAWSELEKWTQRFSQ